MDATRTLFLERFDCRHRHFFFQFAFTASNGTIVAWTITEIWSSLEYRNGFLSVTNYDPLRGVGMINFAASVVILTWRWYARSYLNCYYWSWFLVYEPLTFALYSVAFHVLGTFSIMYILQTYLIHGSERMYDYDPSQWMHVSFKLSFAWTCILTYKSPVSHRDRTHCDELNF